MHESQPGGRRHDIDALRVFAFGLLILYHVGMFYVPWDWHVKSAHQSEALETLMLLVNQWRMPLLFMVSGLAVHFLWGKTSSGEFAWRRITRLGVPLLFGMAVIVPPQAYFQALQNGSFSGGYGEFLLRYFTFQPWPDDAFDGSDIGITWNHLWYLPYLLFYTLAAIPLIAFFEGRGRLIRERMLSLRSTWLVLAPLLPLMLWGAAVYPRFPYISHALLDDWYAHAMYFTFFFYGYLIGRNRGIWAELARIRRVTLALAIGSFALFLGANEIYPPEPNAAETGGLLLVVYANRWLWLLAVLGWGHALLNRPMRWLTYATEAVYPWYVLHQTITVTAGYYLARLSLGPIVEPVLLIAATLLGCLLIHEFVIRRSDLLRPLFGLKPRTESPVCDPVPVKPLSAAGTGSPR
ncbi:MAG: acyltransferase family protein [Xanthomonadales bacterium]|nr:acyltransferase family protein [Xanthomonadales bacterium]